MSLKFTLSSLPLLILMMVLLTLPLWLQDWDKTGQAQAISTPTVPPEPTTAPHPSTVPPVPTAPSDPTPPPIPTSSPSGSPGVTATPTSTSTPQVSATPSTTQTPNPTTTPSNNNGESGNGKRSVLSHSGPKCEDKSIRVRLEVFENNNPKADIEVEFNYNDGQKTTRKTNNQGKVEVSYLYSGEGTIHANPTQGYPGQSFHVDALGCADTGGTSSAGRGGSVLGSATTSLAPTSSLPVGIELYTLGGTIISLVGVGLKIKKSW